MLNKMENIKKEVHKSSAHSIKKMRQGMSYTSKEKTIILNVFKYFQLENPHLHVTKIVRKTATATGCSDKSIFQFRKEEASGLGFKEPSKTKVRKNMNINSRDIKYDNVVRQTIRNVIYDLKYRNIVPSLNTILKHLTNRDDVPKFSLMTLRRLMFDMGFYYEKSGNKSILLENPDMRFLNPADKMLPVDQNNSLPANTMNPSNSAINNGILNKKAANHEESKVDELSKSLTSTNDRITIGSDHVNHVNARINHIVNNDTHLPVPHLSVPNDNKPMYMGPPPMNAFPPQAMVSHAPPPHPPLQHAIFHMTDPHRDMMMSSCPLPMHPNKDGGMWVGLLKHEA